MLNILQKLGDVFHHLVICVKSINEPLYKYLLEKIPEEQVQVIEDDVVILNNSKTKNGKTNQLL